MRFASLFTVEVVNGGLKVNPTEELASMAKDQQTATIKEELKKCEADLQNLNHSTEASKEASNHDRDADKRELEVRIVIMKNFLKRLLESHWEVLKPS